MNYFKYKDPEQFIDIINAEQSELKCTRPKTTRITLDGLLRGKITRNFQNPKEAYKTYLSQKRPKICTCCRVSEAKIYLYHSQQ